MSDKAQRGHSRDTAGRKYGEALEALEDAGSEHAVPIREYVRRLRTEALQARLKVQQLRLAIQEGEDHGE